MSPFLAEISPSLYDRVESGGAGFVNVSRSESRYAPPVRSTRNKREKKLTLAELPVGTKVQHPFFGIGTVKKTSAPSSLDVLFDRHGIKTLHLDYAKLKLL